MLIADLRTSVYPWAVLSLEQGIIVYYVQADLGGEMLIADLRTSVTRQAAFDAVVRVRTSTGRSITIPPIMHLATKDQ